jgi:hypothetical protein
MFRSMETCIGHGRFSQHTFSKRPPFVQILYAAFQKFVRHGAVILICLIKLLLPALVFNRSRCTRCRNCLLRLLLSFCIAATRPCRCSAISSPSSRRALGMCSIHVFSMQQQKKVIGSSTFNLRLYVAEELFLEGRSENPAVHAKTFHLGLLCIDWKLGHTLARNRIHSPPFGRLAFSRLLPWSPLECKHCRADRLVNFGRTRVMISIRISDKYFCGSA